MDPIAQESLLAHIAVSCAIHVHEGQSLLPPPLLQGEKIQFLSTSFEEYACDHKNSTSLLQDTITWKVEALTSIAALKSIAPQTLKYDKPWDEHSPEQNVETQSSTL